MNPEDGLLSKPEIIKEKKRMKNRKKLIALLAVALLIPMTVLAAACQHSRKGSTYNKT